MKTINSKTFSSFNPLRVPSPCFVVDAGVIEDNLAILHDLQEQSGAKVLVALKAFSMFKLAPLFNRYLSGSCASGTYEAKLAYDYYGGKEQGNNHKEVHVYSPAFKQADIDALIQIADHLVFNSPTQWFRFKDQLLKAKENKPQLSFGLRINPMVSTGDHDLYDPCVEGSRLGMNKSLFKQHFSTNDALEGIEGLHFHSLCEQGFDALEPTLKAVEEQFADILPSMKWLNFGGGHHITKADYDREGLIQTIKRIRQQYELAVYIEPGEAVAIHSGVLVSEVLDITENGMPIAILDASATCHMPDTLEMPYRAEILLGNNSHRVAGTLKEKPNHYRLGGQTCLAGDVMGDYSFDYPLKIGDRLMFDDMSHYTMVKTTTFNGIPLPSLAIWHSKTDTLEVIKQFHYNDFENRLS